MPDTATLLLLILTGFIAGVCNAIAGGGTFFTLPIFLAAGLPPVGQCIILQNCTGLYLMNQIARPTYSDDANQNPKTVEQRIR